MCDPKWHGPSTKVKEVDTVTMYTSSSRDKADDTVLLQTFRAWLITDKQSAYIRGIFDGGSQKTFIRQDLSRRLDLPVVEEIVVRLNTFGDSATSGSPQPHRLVQVRLRSQYDQREHVLQAVEIPFICKDLAQAAADEPFVGAVRREGGLIADDLFFPGVKADCGIGLLVGADQLWKVMKSDVRRSSMNDRTVAVNTELGWTFQGPAAVQSSITGDTVLTCTLHVEASNEGECFDLRKFWELESLGVTDEADVKRPEDDAVWKQFQETIEKEDGRYKVGLPWKTSATTLGDNRRVAERRLGSLMKKLRSNHDHLVQYDEAMRKYLTDGHAEVVKEPDRTSTEHVYYMPHQAVVRENSTTTKLRVVFDASSHSPETASLNACLEKGPKLNTELLPLLLRFRTVRVALAADIAKAFLQVVVREQDRDAIRFLWFDETPSEDGQLPTVEVWRMTRVPFGTTSSPFLLAGTIRHHLNNAEDHLAETAKQLAESFYVDDLLAGTQNEEQAERLYREANVIMESAGMELRKWASNSAMLNQIFEEEEGCAGEHYAAAVETNLLGLRWDRRSDNLKLAKPGLSKVTTKASTKRTVLQTSAAVFDPLGFASPFTIRARILFQRIWQLGIDWDEALPDEMAKEWTRWCEELPEIDIIEVPRFVSQGIGDVSEDFQIHIFTDASPAAYGACVYLRTQDSNGKVVVTLMMAKARVAPLKELTLPRLELMGALIGSRLAKVLRSALTAMSLTFFYWTDSNIVLCWIRGFALRWKQFVRNRVTEIQTSTDPAAWRHCPGDQNPADLLTRGESVEKLVANRRWLQGPEWLTATAEAWPESPGLSQTSEREEESVDAERVKALQVLLSATDSSSLLRIETYSRLHFVLRVTAWVLRFVRHCKGGRRIGGPLTADELHGAEVYWVKEAQRCEYRREIDELTHEGTVNPKSPIASFQPMLDRDGVVRISGRLQHTALPAEVRHPVLLPHGHKLTELIVEATHRRLLHGGVQDTITEVRERYWVPRCRQLAKKVQFRCMTCARHRAKPASAPFAPLPTDRVTESPPFQVAGIDFAGPLFVKSPDGDSQKCYIALFTCAVTRAVHLEFVSSMSTPCFLLAFKRFTARRGLPTVIYTDNALTFKGAEKEIWKALKNPGFQDHLSSLAIHWKYIVERGPWWGGFWERLVRSVKNALKKALGRSTFNFEELTTILHGVEAVVNSRPLTAVTDSPDDAEPLTPAHFLVGKRVTSLPAFGISRQGPSADVRAHWKVHQQLLDRFWRRWRAEYLLQLRSAHQVKPSESTPLCIGDLVIVHNERLPRHMWKTGRIAEVFVGRDNNVRACLVKLADGTIFRRPVQLLYPLEAC